MLNSVISDLLALVSGLPPITGFFAIIIATFILEDVAIVGTGLLASTGMVDPILGGAALLVGIVLGDFGLFALGRGAASMPGLRKYVDTNAASKLRDFGANRIFSIVLSTRFVPGMRLPTYTGLGYVRVPFIKFCIAVICAVSLWTMTLYSLVVFLGKNVLETAGPWKWAAIAGVLLVVVFAERVFIRRRRSNA